MRRIASAFIWHLNIDDSSTGVLARAQKLPEKWTFFIKVSDRLTKRRRSDLPPMRQNDPELKIRLIHDFRRHRSKFRYPNREKLDWVKVEIWFQTSCLTKVRFLKHRKTHPTSVRVKLHFPVTRKKTSSPGSQRARIFFCQKKRLWSWTPFGTKILLLTPKLSVESIQNWKMRKVSAGSNCPVPDHIARLLRKISTIFFYWSLFSRPPNPVPWLVNSGS